MEQIDLEFLKAMVSFSNGQSKSSHSGSVEQRFHANVNPSQRQHSSSTSASSSDSDQEEVSTRPAPEKPVATPSLKKKPNSSDRSAVRNRSTPSASKPKKGVAAKRPRDDDFAEEQPESKKKKSVSSAKKVAQEEVPDSNPSRNGLRRQQLESLYPVSRITHSANHPKEESSKKKVRAWTENEENVVMHCFLKYAMEGVEFSEVALKIWKCCGDKLDKEASRVQVYEKMRSMHRRYESIKNKMGQGGIQEDDFVYKSRHEKELYKLWKEAWGKQHEENEMEVHHTEAGGDVAEEEEEVESDGGTDTGKEPKVPSTEKAPVANRTPVKPRVSWRPIPNNKLEDRLQYETIIKETGDILAEVIREVKKMAETSEAELKASLISILWPN